MATQQRSCSSCHSDTHRRPTHKSCPHYIKRARLTTHDEGIHTIRCCTKNGFNKICRSDALARIIERTVHEMTQVTYEASLIANKLVYHCLDNNVDIPRADMQFGMDLMRSASGHRTRNDLVNQAADAYREIRPATLPFARHSSQVVNFAATQYITCCMNHITTNLPKRMERYLKWKLRHVATDISYAARNTCATSLLQHLADDRHDIVTFPRVVEELEDEEERHFFRGRLQHVLDHAFVILGGLPFHKDLVKPRWWEYLAVFRRLLVHVERNIDEAAPLLRRFTLLPIYSFQTRHITIDTKALFHLWHRIHFFGFDPPEDWQAFQEEADEWWRRSFAINKVTTATRRFTKTLMTDGVACSVMLNRPRAPHRGLSISPEGDNGYLEWPTGDNIRVVGVDPGRRDVFTAVASDKTVAKCSTKEYYHLARFDQTRQSREKWMASSGELADLIRDIPMSGVSVSLSFDAFLEYVLGLLRRFLDFYGERRWRRGRWQNYMGRQAAMDKLCRRVIGEGPPENTIVAYGNALFLSSSVGFAAGPVKLLLWEISKRCRVKVIDEFRTSQLCSRCHHSFPTNVNRTYRIRLCQEQHTVAIPLRRRPILWKRDVNAARNMREIYQHMRATGGGRPAAFQRDP
jgi:hypothetical protein